MLAIQSALHHARFVHDTWHPHGLSCQSQRDVCTELTRPLYLMGLPALCLHSVLIHQVTRQQAVVAAGTLAQTLHPPP